MFLIVSPLCFAGNKSRSVRVQILTCKCGEGERGNRRQKGLERRLHRGNSRGCLVLGSAVSWHWPEVRIHTAILPFQFTSFSDYIQGKLCPTSRPLSVGTQLLHQRCKPAQSAGPHPALLQTTSPLDGHHRHRPEDAPHLQVPPRLCGRFAHSATRCLCVPRLLLVSIFNSLKKKQKADERASITQGVPPSFIAGTRVSLLSLP